MRSTGTVFGLQSPLREPPGRTYTEYQWLHDAGGDRALSVIGLGAGLAHQRRIRGARGGRARRPGGTEAGCRPACRTTLSSDLSYHGPHPLTVSRAAKCAWTGRRSARSSIWSAPTWTGCSGPAFSLSGDYRLSLSRQLDLGRTPARYEEALARGRLPPHRNRTACRCWRASPASTTGGSALPRRLAELLERPRCRLAFEAVSGSPRTSSGPPRAPPACCATRAPGSHGLEPRRTAGEPPRLLVHPAAQDRGRNTARSADARPTTRAAVFCRNSPGTRRSTCGSESATTSPASRARWWTGASRPPRAGSSGRKGRY